jgi:hypothetical protein
MVKFGGGFYCALKLEDGMYVFNGFFMTMRSAFVKPRASSIHYYVVEFEDPKDLKLGRLPRRSCSAPPIRRRPYRQIG